MFWIVFDIVVEVLALACALFVIWLLCICPEKYRAEQSRAFQGKSLAHRGLYSKDQSIPENSLPAFRRAVENGYGAELDVQLTSDGRVVVFHDDKLKRMTGAEGKIEDYSFEELSRLRLAGTRESIPLFTEVLKIFEGKQPLIVELKKVGNNDALCAATLALLREYKGDFCVESFDPRIVRWFYKHAPDIMRGQLSEPYAGWRKYNTVSNSLLMGMMLTNFLTRPHFIAYSVLKNPLVLRLCRKMGAFIVVWTAKDPAKHAELFCHCDCVIFEHYQPNNQMEEQL